MTVEAMQRLIDEVITLGNELRRVNDLDQRAKRRPPASPVAVEALTQRFPGKLPPSFLQLLSISDGIDNLDYVDVTIFGSSYLVENATVLEEEWVDAGKFTPGEVFVFARSDWDSVAAAFLPNQRHADGELRVVFFDARGIVGEYDNLEQYLLGCKTSFEQNLAKEAADRAGFQPDD
jgi:hypothetical protein